MSDLVEFLKARLDEEERMSAAPFEVAMAAAWPGLPPGLTQEEAERRTAAALNAAFPYLDPARVLREVEAKRKIVGAWQAYDEASPLHDHAAAVIDGAKRAVGCVLRELAQSYVDHEDYQEAWRV